MLSSMLNSHPAVLCHHELYNPGDIYYALELRGSDFSLAADLQQRDAQPLDFLARVWQHNQAMACVGFKMTHKQNLCVFDAVLADPGIKKIVLRRNNVVKTHVSKLVAEQNGVWEDYGSAGADKAANGECQVMVDWSALQQDIAFNRAFYQEIETRLAQSKQTCLKLEYEHLTAQDSQRDVLAYLGLDYRPLTTPSRKQNPTDLRQRVSNYRQLLALCDDPGLRGLFTSRSA